MQQKNVFNKSTDPCVTTEGKRCKNSDKFQEIKKPFSPRSG